MASIKPDYDHLSELDFLPLAKAMAYTGCKTDNTFYHKYGHLPVYCNRADGKDGIHLWEKRELAREIKKCQIKKYTRL